MRRVAITVDVEAHDFRATQDHVDRLIWGRQAGQERGIGKMMDIADRCGVPLTFFVDYAECEVYGEAILDVAREIKRRGHDPQPHCHLEYLTKKFFGSEDPMSPRLADLAPDQAKKIAAYLVESHISALGDHPLVHRSRGYELGAAYLDALKEAAFVLDASYSLACKYKPLPLGLRSSFRFLNGLVEIPVPFIPYFQTPWPLVPWNFNHRVFLGEKKEENLLRHKNFLDAWFRRHGEGGIATLVMHSWSFWRMDANGFFSIPEEGTMELFQDLLTMLKDDFEIVSLGQIARQERHSPANLESVAADARETHCPVCYEPASHFQDYGAPKCMCPFCHSLERHRTLVDLVYAGAFGPAVFHNKDILHIAPGHPEKLLLHRMYQCRVTTLNILPGCDVQADIQAMPELEDNAFDIVLASEVFRHVRHLDRALAEIARVLRPGGILLCSDCLENAEYGRDITDEAEQISWYGREKLETYGIGDFRRFGRRDWETAFSPWFFTRLFKADDKATGSPAWWLACTPKPLTSPKEPQQADPVMADALLRSNAGRILLDAAHDPLQKFLQDFHSWEEYRQTCVANDLTWLKKNIFTLHFEQIGALPCMGEVADFPVRYPTDVHPHRFQSFAHLLPELAQDSAHGTCPQLHHLISEMTRWIDAYGFSAQALRMDRHTCWMVWHDAAVALRLNFMAYVFLRMLPLPGYPSQLLEKIFRSLLDHFLLLCTNHFFAAHNNHGWLQMFGLLSFCRAMPRLNGSKAATGIATERILALAETLLTPDGMLREHSPAYQAFCITLFAAIRDTLSSSGHSASPEVAALDALLQKMRFCLRCVATPDGELAAFGDTFLKAYPLIAPEVRRAATADSPPAGIALLPRSGCVTLRDGASFLSLSGAFYSYTHKHCDDLSFIWSEGSRNILVDPGEQVSDRDVLYSGPLWEKGFFCSTPNCVYAESAHAHNVVEINGQTWSRRTRPWGALPLSGNRLATTQWLLQGRWHRPEGFLQQRRLILSPGRWLLVLDDLEPQADASAEPADFTQWFHCDPRLEREEWRDGMAIFRLPEGNMLYCQTLAPHTVLTSHKGEVAPRLQGWVAETENPFCLTPAWALGLHQKKTAASFCTLFSLIGPCREGEAIEDGYLLRFTHGETERILWGDRIGQRRLWESRRDAPSSP